jgi:hypothetical protein
MRRVSFGRVEVIEPSRTSFDDEDLNRIEVVSVDFFELCRPVREIRKSIEIPSKQRNKKKQQKRTDGRQKKKERRHSSGSSSLSPLPCQVSPPSIPRKSPSLVPSKFSPRQSRSLSPLPGSYCSPVRYRSKEFRPEILQMGTKIALLDLDTDSPTPPFGEEEKHVV